MMMMMAMLKMMMMAIKPRSKNKYYSIYDLLRVLEATWRQLD